MSQPCSSRVEVRRIAIGLLILQTVPAPSYGQTSPFDTGADSLLTWALGIGVPIAALAIIGLGLFALVGRISWGAAVSCILGIALVFGAPQIVTWVQGIFGV